MKLLQIVLGILVFVAVGVYAVLQQVRVVQIGYDLHSAESEADRLEEANRQLLARISQLRNPSRLAQAAVAWKLDLVPGEERNDWSASPTRPLPGTGTSGPAESEAVSDTSLQRRR